MLWDYSSTLSILKVLCAFCKSDLQLSNRRFLDHKCSLEPHVSALIKATVGLVPRLQVKDKLSTGIVCWNSSCTGWLKRSQLLPMSQPIASVLHHSWYWSYRWWQKWSSDIVKFKSCVCQYAEWHWSFYYHQGKHVSTSTKTIFLCHGERWRWEEELLTG